MPTALLKTLGHPAVRGGLKHVLDDLSHLRNSSEKILTYDHSGDHMTLGVWQLACIFDGCSTPEFCDCRS